IRDLGHIDQACPVSSLDAFDKKRIHRVVFLMHSFIHREQKSPERVDCKVLCRVPLCQPKVLLHSCTSVPFSDSFFPFPLFFSLSLLTQDCPSRSSQWHFARQNVCMCATNVCMYVRNVCVYACGVVCVSVCVCVCVSVNTHTRTAQVTK